MGIVKVGIGVLVFKKGKILLGKRQGSHGAGEYACPGGHLEFGESFKQCAKRECLEEVGIEIKNVRLLRLSNLKKYKGKHYVDIGLAAEWKSGKIKNIKNEKIKDWKWYNINALPKPLFGHIEYSIEALNSGKNFFDE